MARQKCRYLMMVVHKHGILGVDGWLMVATNPVLFLD